MNNKIELLDIIIYNPHTKIEICFPGNCLVCNDSHAGIELYGFHFGSHTHSCKSCKALLDDLNINHTDWLIKIDNEIKVLDLQYEITNIEEPFGNSYFDTSGKKPGDFWGTKLRFKMIKPSEALEYLIETEYYEKCVYFRDELKIKLDWQNNDK